MCLVVETSCVSHVHRGCGVEIWELRLVKVARFFLPNVPGFWQSNENAECILTL